LHEFNQKFLKNLKGFSTDAQNYLLSYEFTGNARELKNMIERAVLIAKKEYVELDNLRESSSLLSDIPVSDFKYDQNLGPEGIDLANLLENIEKNFMKQALAISKGNESKAARLLNMNHHTFRYRWKRISGK
jgi:transcriptional regulator with PAS, ATPase and Fis domain